MYSIWVLVSCHRLTPAVTRLAFSPQGHVCNVNPATILSSILVTCLSNSSQGFWQFNLHKKHTTPFPLFPPTHYPYNDVLRPCPALVTRSSSRSPP